MLLSGVFVVSAETESAPGSYVGSAACAPCHSAIYKSYSATPMAQASGKVGTVAFQENLAQGEFVHSLSGTRYRIFKDQDDYYLEFSKEPSPSSPQKLQGRRRLDYFVGSGAAARGYIFSMDGYWFQSPVSYYSLRRKWDMAPGYEQDSRLDLTRAVERNCLECHASRVQPIWGTHNRYAEVPFLEGSVSCERCHGPGSKHIGEATSGTGSPNIVNPARLDPLRRDSICARCHLRGEVSITRAGRSLYTFRPGELLTEYIASFTWSPAETKALKVVGHFEKLWQSRCKKASGDRLWCGTCHDPHSLPTTAARQEYFRQKCLSCHQDSACKSSSSSRVHRHNDCVGCHMPKNRALDGGHTSFTDHAIPRKPDGKPRRETVTTGRTLALFWGGVAEVRELGLAYAKLAGQEQNGAYESRAFELLKKAESEKVDDAEVLFHLGDYYDRKADEDKAMVLYQRALAKDPDLIAAGVNLGVLLGKRGRYLEAIRLWEDALKRNSGLESVRLNLAKSYLRVGNCSAAKKVLLEALEYNPDFQSARELLSDPRLQSN
jgi:hypothetical protein